MYLAHSRPVMVCEKEIEKRGDVINYLFFHFISVYSKMSS